MTATTGAPAGPRHIEYLPLSKIERATSNPKRHAEDRIAGSIARFGLGEVPLIDERTGRLVAGHGRYDDLLARHAAGQEPPDGVLVGEDGEWLMPVVRGWRSRSDADADAYLIASNRTTELGGWDDTALAEMLQALNAAEPDLAAIAGYDDDDLAALLSGLADGTGGSRGDLATTDPGPAGPSLADRFLIPPFDVLDARQGWWQERKRAWLALGIRSEVGRGARLTQTSAQTADMDYYRRAEGKKANAAAARLAAPGGGGGVWRGRRADGSYGPPPPGYGTEVVPQDDPTYAAQKSAAEAAAGTALTDEEFIAEHYVPGVESGTSVFDPVLCELAYRWFTPPGGHILDPFAGGSVRGLIAGMLGRRYTGNDLSAEQIAANEEQGAQFLARGLITEAPQWTAGDSAEWVTGLPEGLYDGILTCPPYLWLERYSDDPADLSTLAAEDFERIYAGILAGSARALAPNRYAVIVVGDVRDQRTDHLIDFRGMTIRAAEAAGLRLQSGAVLVTAVGSLAVRAGPQFTSGRLLGRTHQDVLVFTKGERRAAVAALGPVEVSFPDAVAAEFAAGPGPAALAPPAPDYTPEYTPVEEHGGYLVKRDDAWTTSGAGGAKARAMIHAAQATSAAGIVSAGARISPQLERAALAARACGIPCRLHTGAGADTAETLTARAAGAEVITHRPGRLSVIKARYEADAAALAGQGWLCVPFGMNHPLYLAEVAEQAAHLPFGTFSRIVVPAGSGMTMAGILLGLREAGQAVPVLGVAVGGAPGPRLDEHAPGWQEQAELVTCPIPYEQHAENTVLGGLRLDPVYEAKCLEHLQPGDLLWAVGIRSSAAG